MIEDSIYLGEYPFEFHTLSLLIRGFEKDIEMRSAISVGLTSQHFQDVKHKRIFECMEYLYGKKQKVSFDSIYPMLMKEPETLNSLLDIVKMGSRTENTEYYVKSTIMDYQQKHEANEIAYLNGVFAATTDPEQRDEIREKLKKLLSTNHFEDIEDRKSRHISEYTDGVIEDLETDMRSASEGQTSGIPTGIQGLDDVLYGWRKGKLYVVGAKPGMGKTTLACNFAYLAAKRSDTCFFTLEMKAREITEKIISRSAKVRISKFRLGHSTDQDARDLLHGVEDVKSTRFFVNDSSKGFYENFEAEVRRMKEVGQLDLAILDYIQLFRTKGRFSNRNAEVSHITTSLKQLSIELDLPIIALSQLNRNVERENREPRPSDLRDSGSIEQDADAIIFISKDRDDSRYLTLAKNRGGVEGINIPLKTDLTTNYLGE